MSTATKEKATHTKGPWHYGPPQGRDYTEVPICSTIQEPGEYFATVHFTGDGDETDANARLIAAAPELLEACRKAEAGLSQLAAVLGEQFQDYSTYRDAEAGMIAVQAAIQKAESGS